MTTTFVWSWWGAVGGFLGALAVRPTLLLIGTVLRRYKLWPYN